MEQRHYHWCFQPTYPTTQIKFNCQIEFTIINNVKKESTYKLINNCACNFQCELASRSLTCYLLFLMVWGWRWATIKAYRRIFQLMFSLFFLSFISVLSNLSYHPRDNIWGYIFFFLFFFPFWLLTMNWRVLQLARPDKAFSNIFINKTTSHIWRR